MGRVADDHDLPGARSGGGQERIDHARPRLGAAPAVAAAQEREMPEHAESVEHGARRRFAIHGCDAEHDAPGRQAGEERVEVDDRYRVAPGGFVERAFDDREHELDIESADCCPGCRELQVRAGGEHRVRVASPGGVVIVDGGGQRPRIDPTGETRNFRGGGAIGGNPGRAEIKQGAVLVQQDAAYRAAAAGVDLRRVTNCGPTSRGGEIHHRASSDETSSARYVYLIVPFAPGSGRSSRWRAQ